MATNVTEKDKALQEVIDWLKDQLDQEQDSIHCAQVDRHGSAVWHDRR